MNSSFKTPVLVFDSAKLEQKVKHYLELFDFAKIYYAVKANPDATIIRTFAGFGLGFEVASLAEFQYVRSFGVDANKIISSNPIKHPGFVSEAYKDGLKYYAFDSEEELIKIKELASDATIYVRLRVENKGSDWPLTKKFGVDYQHAIQLVLKAKEMGLNIRGLTFHVGSQCREITNWKSALEISAKFFEECKRDGITLNLLNIGGGIPIDHGKPGPDETKVSEYIRSHISKLFGGIDDLEIIMEPGRSLVGDSATMITTVIGKAKRGDENWASLDVGVFNGLMETVDGFVYQLSTENPNRKKVQYTLCGPSCDSVDTMFENITLPELEIGDKVFIHNAGAYTTAYTHNFNGFPPPTIEFT